MDTATPEDVLIAKLEWAKLGESERQIRDSAGILRVQRAQLDIAYIEHWVRELGLDDEWRRAQEMSGEMRSCQP